MSQARCVGPDRHLLFDGQSLNDFGSYPAKVNLGYPALYGMTLRNLSVGGFGWEDLAANADTRLFPYCSTAPTTVLMMNGCQNDLLDDDDAATVYALMVAYADAARLTGGVEKVLAVTVPAADPSYFTAGQDAERQALNATLVATGVSSGDFDAIADIAAAPELDGTDPTYYLDIVHWTPAGAQVAADIVRPVLLDMLGL